MRFSANWLDDARNAAPEERATVAEFQLWIGNQNVAVHAQSTFLSDHVVISLYGLAEGLAHNWWNIFGARDREFSFLNWRSGFIVPDVRMSFDGSVFEVASFQRNYRDRDIRFWGGQIEVMTRDDAEMQLASFIDLILNRLEFSGVDGTSAKLRWARVKRSLNESDEAIFCEAAGSLGLDPYNIDEMKAATIERANRFFEREPLTEFLAGANASQSDENHLLNWIEASEGRSKETSLLANLKSLAIEAAERAPRKSMETGWCLGYRRAAALRELLGSRRTQRMRDVKRLAEKLGATRHFSPAPPVNGIRALRVDRHDEVHVHLRDHGSRADSQSANLFSLARAVGDAVCFPERSRSVVNELRNAHRQSAGRSFAAELLAPISEIAAMRHDGKDAVSIANEFGVSTVVVDRQWENRDRIATALAER